MKIINLTELNEVKENLTELTELTFIKPDYLMEGTAVYKKWEQLCSETEKLYFQLLEWGLTTDECEFILPLNCIIKHDNE